jgi:transposase
MARKYHVTLTDAERAELHDFVHKGTVSARKLTRAHILLHADAGATDATIADALHVSERTVERIRQRCVEGNLTGALAERPRPGARRTRDMKQKAFLIATTCSTPPTARRRWTLRLLAAELVALEVVDAISYETVRRTLKKPSEALASRGMGHSDRQRRVCRS